MVNDMLVDKTNMIVCRSCKSCSRSWPEKSWWCLRSPSLRRGRGTSSGNNATTSKKSCVDYFQNDLSSWKLSWLIKTLPALSLPLPIECWVYNATRLISFVILWKKTNVNSKWKFLMWCQQARWSVESVHTKNIVSILHLLVALARHFR